MTWTCHRMRRCYAENPIEATVCHGCGQAVDPSLAGARQAVGLAWGQLCVASFDLANGVNAGIEGPEMERREGALRQAAGLYTSALDDAIAAAAPPKGRGRKR